MTDHFASLGVACAPWLDPEKLKERFLALSAELHPDKASFDKKKAEAEFQQLNQSYQTLLNTRSRLLHLLELHGIPKPDHVQAIPPVALDLFSAIAEVTRQSDLLLKEKAASSSDSPMLKVQFFERALAGVESLQNLQNDVQARILKIETELRVLPVTAIEALQHSAAALGFLERWRAQLQERAAALTF